MCSIVNSWFQHMDVCSKRWPLRQYKDENDLRLVRDLVDNELSEPYSVFTYRYFVHSWPDVCFLAGDDRECHAAIICKVDMHGNLKRGYIAMLVVRGSHRGLGYGTELVSRAISRLVELKADEVVLEAETSNVAGLRLYQKLGFIRDKRLSRYYLSGTDAFRLKLMLPQQA